MRVLIVGARGMLGTDLVRFFGTRHEVFAVDIDELDMSDPEQCRNRLLQIRPSVTICAAALTAVDYCESHESEAMLVNGAAPGFLAAAAAEVGSMIVHYSTDYIFDGAKTVPYVEDDEPNPVSIYGKSKLLGDTNVQRHNPEHLILRTSWVFGPNGRNFVRTVVGAARQGQSLRVVDDQRGRPSYTRDLCDFTARLLEAGCRGVYNLTNDGCCTWFDLARHALDSAGLQGIPIVPVPTSTYPRPARRPANSVLANARLEREGFPLMRPWQEAVSEYVTTELV